MTLFLLLFSALSAVMNSPDLEALRWQKRVILLFAAELTDPSLLQQRQAFAPQSSALAQRDLQVFELIGSSDDNDKLRQHFGVSGKSFAIILIGKDGTRKLRSYSPVEPAKLFALIDSMPMRRNEMKYQ